MKNTLSIVSGVILVALIVIIVVYMSDNVTNVAQISDDSDIIEIAQVDVSTGESCSIDAECETPMDYLIRSSCPFSSKCIEGQCTVVCVDRYRTELEQATQTPQCTIATDCDCSTFYASSDLKGCSCIDGSCTAIVSVF